MDHAMQLRHLEEAERHIVEGKRHIAEQEERLAAFTRKGYDITEAQRFLDNLLASQVQHIRHRDLILQALNR
jgi:ferritin